MAFAPLVSLPALPYAQTIRGGRWYRGLCRRQWGAAGGGEGCEIAALPIDCCQSSLAGTSSKRSTRPSETFVKCGPLEEGMVKDGVNVGCLWVPGWAVAALCCGVPVVLGGMGRVPAVPGGSSWLVWLALGLAGALHPVSTVARGCLLWLLLSALGKSLWVHPAFGCTNSQAERDEWWHWGRAAAVAEGDCIFPCAF